MALIGIIQIFRYKFTDILLNKIFHFPLKGLDHSSVGLHLVSNIIKDELGLPDVSVLMGANLAKEVAREMFGEATIGK